MVCVIQACAINAVFLLAASYAGCNAELVALFFAISVGGMGLQSSSTMVNAMDLSPNFAASIMAIVNGIGSLAGIAVPWVIGLLTPNVMKHTSFKLI